jgi:hypothetical protein
MSRNLFVTLDNINTVSKQENQQNVTWNDEHNDSRTWKKKVTEAVLRVNRNLKAYLNWFEIVTTDQVIGCLKGPNYPTEVYPNRKN